MEDESSRWGSSEVQLAIGNRIDMDRRCVEETSDRTQFARDVINSAGDEPSAEGSLPMWHTELFACSRVSMGSSSGMDRLATFPDEVQSAENLMKDKGHARVCSDTALYIIAIIFISLEHLDIKLYMRHCYVAREKNDCGIKTAAWN